MIWNKRITSVVTSAVFTMSALCTTAQFVFSSGEEVSAELTSQTAQQITSQMTIGWNLGNTLDATAPNGTPSTASPKKFATAWGNPEPTEELIDTVNKAGFNTIRIPTTWYQHLEYNEATDTYEINENWMAYVKQVVDWAYERDMFIILNIHHEQFINVAQFTDETLAEAQKKVGDIWKQVSKEFENYDQHLIFEGMNEPRQKGNSSVSEWGNGGEDGGYSWKYINTLNQTFIDAIRSEGSAANSERLLMIPAYVATTDTQALNAVEIPEGSGNIALSTHAYSPYFFTMATDKYANHEFPGKSGYGEDYEQSLATLFSNLKSVSQSKNVPIIMGEFSASDFSNTESRVNWAKSYLGYAKDAGIPCVLWDNNVVDDGTASSGEAHGYIYRATNTIYPNSKPVLAAMMDTVGVTDYVLPDYKEYEKPAFSWDTVGIEDNWVELYRNDEGKKLDAWKNMTVDGWKDYANEKYMFAFVYDSDDKAEIVFMNSSGGENWNRVAADDDKSKQFVAYFTYDEIVSSIIGGGTLEDMDCLFLSATMKELTAYGLYAVPVAGEQPVDPPVGVNKGDLNLDDEVNCIDFVLMKNHILTGREIAAAAEFNADMDSDGNINVKDVLMLKKLILNVA
ncbi:MAG: cellulase family glycosylhydrolase [Oscillospiraceae bacterium]